MQQQVYQKLPIRPMKLFNEWDVENTSPNCIPRACCLRIVRLEIFDALEVDLKAVALCVVMQGSRRSLRSDQIPVQMAGVVDAELDLLFTLQMSLSQTPRETQTNISKVLAALCERKNMMEYTTTQPDGYPHFLKRRQNTLQISIQRRKKYRNRTILGFKTLATSYVNMDQVLQGWCSNQLNFYTKDEKTPAATLTIASLTSEPIDREMHDRRNTLSSIAGNINMSSDDEDSYSSDVDDSAGEIEGIPLERFSRHAARLRKVRSRNFKQKIIQVLFKKLKVTDSDLGDVQKEFCDEHSEEDDEDFLSEEDDDYFVDNESLMSVKRPGLRPFFDHSQSSTTLDIGTLRNSHAREKNEEAGALIIEENKEGSLSSESESEVSFTNRFTEIFSVDDVLPDYILLVGIPGESGKRMAIKLMPKLSPILFTPTASDVHATLTAIGNKLQKICSRRSTAPPTLRVVVLGPESFLCLVVSSFVEEFSKRRQEYQNYLKFLVIPSVSPFKVANYIGQLDAKYKNLFLDFFWRNVFEKSFLVESDLNEVVRRILHYLENSESIHSIPIAEALLTCKSHTDEDSIQVFLPFITGVRLGTLDPDDTDCFVKVSSPKKDGTLFCTCDRKESSRNEINDCLIHPLNGLSETLEMVVDFWPIPSVSSTQMKKDERKENKVSIKSVFKALSVQRLSTGDQEGLVFSAHMKTRNKGVKRLMKPRDKDAESKSFVAAYVSKIICTAKSCGQTFTIYIDGQEWSNVKFFSLSSQWPTHIKFFPVGMFLNYKSQP